MAGFEPMVDPVPRCEEPRTMSVLLFPEGHGTFLGLPRAAAKRRVAFQERFPVLVE